MKNYNLYKPDHLSPPKAVLRGISVVLVSFFLLQEIAWANPDLKPIEWNKKEDFTSWAKASLPNIPESIATIEDAYKAPDSKKTFILIQDAHTNTSGQINVSKTLDLLFSKETLKYIFLEAGSGNESLSFLKKYAPLEKRKKIADYFLKSGKLQGTEYLDLTSDHNFVLWGVEDLSLYAQSVTLYRDVVKVRENFQDYLAQVESTIKTLKAKIYNPFLLAFDEKYQKYNKEEITLTDYFDILSKEAERHDISLGNYRHMKSFKKLRHLEAKIDFQKASKEQESALFSLSKSDQRELFTASRGNNLSKLSAHDSKIQNAFFSLLREKLNNDSAKYPELFKYLYYLDTSKEIEAKSILEEQKDLETKVFQALTDTADEASLIKASKNLEILKKFLNFTLTPDEYKHYQADKQSFDITHITGFLNRKIMDLQCDYESAAFIKSGYEDAFKKCEGFYQLTYLRDQKFMENILPKMDQERQNKAVLITGGYHSPNIKFLLKKRGISYICLTPQILHETNMKRYEKILLRANFNQVSQSLVASPSSASTNMPLRILTLGGLGVPDYRELARLLADTSERAKPIIQEIKKREKDLGGPPMDIGGPRSVGGWPVVSAAQPIRVEPLEKTSDRIRRSADYRLLKKFSRTNQKVNNPDNLRRWLDIRDRQNKAAAARLAREESLLSRRRFLGQAAAGAVAAAMRPGNGIGQTASLAAREFKFNPAEAQALAIFLDNNTTRDGMPLSFAAPKGYWKSIGSRPNNVDDILERLLTGEKGFEEAGAINIYDGATWQIVMALQGKTERANDWTERLASGRSGALQEIRATQERFTFNGQKLPSSESFFFRMISDRYLMRDPLDGKSEFPNFPTIPELHHEDWKPIAGENAWGPIIGPLQTAHLKSSDGNIALDSEEVELALSVLPAVEAMQSPIGAIYHVPSGTANKDPRDISNENNFSMYAALKMLLQVLEQKQNREKAQSEIQRINKILKGMESYFKEHSFNQATGIFYQGGFLLGDTFRPSRDFAVDVQTWGITVLGADWINKELGNGDEETAYKIWQNTKKRAGYMKNGVLRGVGFTNGHTVLSSEWTFGAILMAKEIASYYENPAKLGDAKNQAMAQDLWKDADTMRQGVEELKVTLADGSIAYKYVNKRYYIVFGWWANPIPSVAGTTWAFMMDQANIREYFNPFILGGGPHNKRAKISSKSPKANEFAKSDGSQKTGIVVRGTRGSHTGPGTYSERIEGDFKLERISDLRITFSSKQAGTNFYVRLLPKGASTNGSTGLSEKYYTIPESGVVTVPLTDFSPADIDFKINIQQISIHSGHDAWDAPLDQGADRKASFSKIEMIPSGAGARLAGDTDITRRAILVGAVGLAMVGGSSLLYRMMKGRNENKATIVEKVEAESFIPQGFLAPPDELIARLRFQQTNVDNLGTPKSYKPSNAYWESVGHEANSVDHVIERLLTDGLSIYDISTAQITSVIEGDPYELDHVTESLLRGYYGSLDNIRANDGRVFQYGEKKIKLGRGAFFFRILSKNGDFLQTDPLTGNTHVKGYPPMMDHAATNRDRIYHPDWKPIAGENAWAGLIGPLQVAFAKNGKKINYYSKEVKLAVEILTGIEAMQSEIGGIYHAPTGTDGKDPHDISNENNISMIAGLKMLIQVLKMVLDQENAKPEPAEALDKEKWIEKKNEIESNINRAELVLYGDDKGKKGIYDYFKNYAFDKETGVMYQGGFYLYDAPNKEFVPTKDFAVDVQTWGISVLGPEQIDQWYGEGSTLKMWRETKRRAGFLKDGVLKGVGFTDGDDVLSGEWTFGAIQAVLDLARYYEKRDADAAKSLVMDAESMRKGVDEILKVVNEEDGTISYLYANRRYYIRFGWWANNIPSLVSTTWATMVDTGFNPFILGGGAHYKKPDFASTEGQSYLLPASELVTRVEEKNRSYIYNGQNQPSKDGRREPLLRKLNEYQSMRVRVYPKPGERSFKTHLTVEGFEPFMVGEPPAYRKVIKLPLKNWKAGEYYDVIIDVEEVLTALRGKAYVGSVELNEGVRPGFDMALNWNNDEKTDNPHYSVEFFRKKIEVASPKMQGQPIIGPVKFARVAQVNDDQSKTLQADLSSNALNLIDYAGGLVKIKAKPLPTLENFVIYLEDRNGNVVRLFRINRKVGTNEYAVAKQFNPNNEDEQPLNYDPEGIALNNSVNGDIVIDVPVSTMTNNHLASLGKVVLIHNTSLYGVVLNGVPANIESAEFTLFMPVTANEEVIKKSSVNPSDLQRMRADNKFELAMRRASQASPSDAADIIRKAQQERHRTLLTVSSGQGASGDVFFGARLAEDSKIAPDAELVAALDPRGAPANPKITRRRVIVIGASALGIVSGTTKAQTAKVAEKRLQFSSADTMRTMRFIVDNRTSDGLPFSFSADTGYFASINHPKNDIGAVMERLMVGEQSDKVSGDSGTLNLYDGAVGQMAAAITGNPKMADTYTDILASGRTEGLDSIRATPEDFTFNGTKLDPKRAFFFRTIARKYLQKDPLDGKTSLNHFPTRPELHHEDFKPIAGENAWVIIGLLQTAFKKYKGKVPLDSLEVRGALSLLSAFEAMQSPTGGIYHAPQGTANKDPRDISTENNASAFSAFKMLLKILEENAAMAKNRNNTALKNQVRITRKILYGDSATKHKGIEGFFKEYAFDKENNLFYQGGRWVDGDFKHSDDFAVDAQTWTVAVFGPEWIVKNIGNNKPESLYTIWLNTIKLGGYYENDVLRGVGFTKGRDILSSEWTFGAILMAKEMAHYYESLAKAQKGWQAYADKLWPQADSMRQGVETLKIVRKDGSVAYKYANKRYYIVFGWWANPIASLAGTGWSVFMDRTDFKKYFNPFILGGGAYNLEVDAKVETATAAVNKPVAPSQKISTRDQYGANAGENFRTWFIVSNEPVRGLQNYSQLEVAVPVKAGQGPFRIGLLLKDGSGGEYVTPINVPANIAAKGGIFTQRIPMTVISRNIRAIKEVHIGEGVGFSGGVLNPNGNNQERFDIGNQEVGTPEVRLFLKSGARLATDDVIDKIETLVATDKKMTADQLELDAFGHLVFVRILDATQAAISRYRKSERTAGDTARLVNTTQSLASMLQYGLVSSYRSEGEILLNAVYEHEDGHGAVRDFQESLVRLNAALGALQSHEENRDSIRFQLFFLSEFVRSFLDNWDNKDIPTILGIKDMATAKETKYLLDRADRIFSSYFESQNDAKITEQNLLDLQAGIKSRVEQLGKARKVSNPAMSATLHMLNLALLFDEGIQAMRSHYPATNDMEQGARLADSSKFEADVTAKTYQVTDRGGVPALPATAHQPVLKLQTLRRFFAGLAIAFSSVQLDNQTLAMQGDNSVPAIFKMSFDGSKLVAVSDSGLRISLNKDWAMRLSRGNVAQGPRLQDIALAETTLNRRVRELLYDIDSKTTVVVAFDLGILDNKNFEIYLAGLSTVARQLRRENIYIYLAGSRYLMEKLAGLDTRGFIDDDQKAVFTKAGALEVFLTPPGQWYQGINMPFNAIAEGDVPPFVSGARLAAAAARLGKSPLTIGFRQAWALLAGVGSVDSLDARQVMDGKASKELGARLAFKQLFRVGIGQVLQLFGMRRKQVEQAA